MRTRAIIPGVSLLAQAVHRDGRGELVAFEEFGNVPFPPKRVFTIKVDGGETSRGGHANSCDELVSVMSGAVTIEVSDGEAWDAVRLTGSHEALWIKPGILIRLTDFAPGTILLVCASERYEDTRHYDGARPNLLREAFLT